MNEEQQSDSSLDVWLLQKLEDMLGDRSLLARSLGVSTDHLSVWLSAKAPMPNATFMKAVDLLLQVWTSEREERSPTDGKVRQLH